MIVLIRKRSIVCCCLLCVFLLSLSTILWAGHTPDRVVVFAPSDGVQVTVVVDPGHGGEDGGAVSTDGVLESKINLEISLRLNNLLRFAGQRTVMTRTGEGDLHTEGETIAARKSSDVRNRVALVNGTENAVLLSVHQNSLPSSTVTFGAQAFWNGMEGAETLAEVVQDSLNTAINIHKAKQPKKISDSIYLMKHVTAPAVLVECGFLSNAGETARLQEPSHQRMLAAAIAAGYLRALSGEEIVK